MATPATVAAGGSAGLTGVFANGTGLITPGDLTAVSGTAVTVTPSATTVYTLTVSSGSATPAVLTTTVTVAPAPLTPVLTAPVTVTANTSGLTASVAAQAGGTYAWTITGGTITGGGATNQITFTAGPAGTLQLGCIVTTAGGASPQGTAAVAVVAAPTTPVITAPVDVATGVPGFTASVPAQPGCTFTWTLAGGALTAGAGTPQITFTPGTGSTVQLGCVATNAAGTASAPGTATCFILAAPPVITAPAYAAPNAAGLIASVPVVTGATYSWTVSGGTLTSGATASQITYSAPASGTVTLGCTVTNAAGAAGYPGTATTLVVFPPDMPNITAPGYVTSGATGCIAAVPAQQRQTGNTYVWTISGDSVITAGATTAQITFTAGTAGSVQITCVPTNGLGISGPQGSVTSTIVPAPVASLAASQPSLVAGGSVTLTATFTGGTGTVSPGVGTVSSPWTLTLTPSTTLNYTLTVTNQAGTAVSSQAHVPVGSLSVLAGTPSGIGSVNGTGSAARFYLPRGVASDGQNLYVADSYNNVIRKVTSSGVVTTLAGAAGFSGSADGAGTDARFNAPASLALDAHGNLYVADTNNSTIRKIAPGGLVTTVAGKASVTGTVDDTGANARFNFPKGLAVDPNGDLYVADTNNGTIRFIKASTGAVSTLAGGGTTPSAPDGVGAAATFVAPGAVAVDGSFNVYIADSGNALIRKMTVANGTGTVTTLAGAAGVTGSADGAPASARFNSPGGLTVDGSGNVYVADTLNCTLRMITPSGAVSTLAGAPLIYGGQDSPGARFDDPAQLALDGAGNLYVADAVNNTIRKVVLAGAVVSTPAGLAGTPGHSDSATPLAATFNGPAGLAVDAAGNVYLADAGNHTIRMIANGSGAVTTLAGTPGRPGAMDGAGATASFNFPQGAAVDASGRIYVADTENCTIRLITVNAGVGQVSTLAGAGSKGSSDGQGVLASFFKPYGVAVDSQGNVYVADTFNCAIRMITPSGKVSTVAGTPGSAGSQNGQGASATFNYPFSLAVDGAFNLYVADTDNHTIRKISPSGLVTTLAGQAGIPGTTDGPGSTALFNHPNYIAVDANGILYVADTFNGAIRQITPDGMVSTILGTIGSSQLAMGPFPAQLAIPGAVAVSASGMGYITVNDAVLKAGF